MNPAVMRDSRRSFDAILARRACMAHEIFTPGRRRSVFMFSLPGGAAGWAQKDRQRPMKSASIILLALALTGCGRFAPWGASATPPSAGEQQADDGDSGYRAPPRV